MRNSNKRFELSQNGYKKVSLLKKYHIFYVFVCFCPFIYPSVSQRNYQWHQRRRAMFCLIKKLKRCSYYLRVFDIFIVVHEDSLKFGDT